jgi:hypothetical protein
VQPTTFRQRYGGRLLTPELMPPHDVDLDRLPGSLEEAASAGTDVPAYPQPAVELPKRASRSRYTPEERREIGERLQRARRKALVSA